MTVLRGVVYKMKSRGLRYFILQNTSRPILVLANSSSQLRLDLCNIQFKPFAYLHILLVKRKRRRNIILISNRCVRGGKHDKSEYIMTAIAITTLMELGIESTNCLHVSDAKSISMYSLYLLIPAECRAM